MEVFHTPWKLIQNQIRSPGGYAIDKFRGKTDPKDIPNGSEAWIGSTVRARGATEECPDFGCAEVILSDGRKMYLYQAIESAPEEILGAEHIKRSGSSLGMLVKLLDAKQQYFLQAHPTRRTAAELFNSPYGKEEAWYIVGLRDDVQEEPYILLGFKEGVTKKLFEDTYHNGTLADLEKLCHKIAVNPGETYFVPGGMPHALGAGCLALEVQEPSDLAVIAIPQEELLDFRRKAAPNAVFFEEDNRDYEYRMFNTFVFAGTSKEAVTEKCRSKKTVLRSVDWGTEYSLIGKDRTEYFACTLAEVDGGKMPIKNTGDVRIGVVLDGNGVLESSDYRLKIKQGDEIFFPFDVKETYLSGKVKMIFAHPQGAEY